MIPTNLIVYGVIAAAIFGGGFYTKGVFAGKQIAEMELAYEHERTMAALATASALEEARKVETLWRSSVDEAAAAAEAASKVSHDRIRALVATNGKLSKRLSDIVEASRSPADPGTAYADLLQYVERAGPLVAELDSFAGEAAETADRLRDELDLCRNYVKAIQ